MLVTLALFVAINGVSFFVQKPLTYNHGLGWDGAVYYSVAQQFTKHKSPVGEGPFVYRIGTPLLVASCFEKDLLTGFKVVNVFANLLTTLLFVYWLRLYLRDWRIRTLMAALFLIAWHGPIRFVYYYPVLCDNWLFVFLLAGLIGIHKLRTNLSVASLTSLTFIAFAGVLVREATVVIPVAALFVANPLVLHRPTEQSWIVAQVKLGFRRFSRWLLLPLVGAFLGVLCAKWAVSQSVAYSFFGTALWWLYNKPLLLYVQSWFAAFGPLIVLLFYYRRDSWRFLTRHQFMLVYLLGFAVLAWIGGADTERLLYWSAPVVFLLIGKVLEDHAILRFGIFPIALLGTQLISQRAFWGIPDYPAPYATPFPILTIPSNSFQYLDLYSWHGNRDLQMIILLEYALLSVVLLTWLNYSQMRHLSRTCKA